MTEKETKVSAIDHKIPEYIDPAFDNQYYDGAVHMDSHSPEPENRLWVAVLGQMIEDATLPRAKKSTHAAKAIVESDHARACVFAPFGTTADDFKMVCDLAGWDPGFVRRCVSAAIEHNVQVTREAFSKMALPGQEEEPEEGIP